MEKGSACKVRGYCRVFGFTPRESICRDCGHEGTTGWASSQLQREGAAFIKGTVPVEDRAEVTA